jgi:hypothetical protein
LPVPVNGRVANGNGEVVRWYQVQIDGSAVLCHDEIVSVTSKKQGASASASQPKDAVPGDEVVQVPQNFINGTEFTSIDFGTGYKFVMGWLKALN